MGPRVSGVVRSFNRLAALGELLTALLAQDHDSFEIVVVEQSTLRMRADLARIDQRARRDVLSFIVLKWQRVYARTDQKKRVQSLMGGNAAIPRKTLERFGLWDECTPIEDEPSLADRINAGKRDDEFLMFDPEVKMIRRLDVPGGMAKRTLSGPAYAQRVFTFLHNIIGHYFPLRFVLLYPAYIYFVAYHCIQWICSDSKKHQTLLSRIWATAGIIVSLLPLWFFWLGQWLYLRLRVGEPAQRPLRDAAPARLIPDLALLSPRAAAGPQDTAYSRS